MRKIKIERIKDKKKVIIGSLIFISIVTTLILITSKAKYKNIQSIDLASGTINYTPYDFKVMAMYKNDGSGDVEINEMPSSGYTINEEKSFCYIIDINNHDSNAKLYTLNTGEHVIANLDKNDKCYLYFDKLKGEEIINKIKNQSKGSITSFTGIATNEDTGIYTASDDYGTSYYFRGLGDSLNNWVRFAGFYWRIIRINGNNSIRMIYQGVANGAISNSNKLGDTTVIGMSMYNHTSSDNAYLGYMMGIPLNENTSSVALSPSTSYSQAHTNTYDSDAKKTVDSWYKTNIADKNFESYIDTNAGFCNDRQLDKTADSRYQGDGYGSQGSGYAPWGRLHTSTNNSWKTTQTPILRCSNKTRDLFTVSVANEGNKKLTYPIGMITSDEIVFAGGFGARGNSTFYLNTNQNFWTMSPYGRLGAYAEMFQFHFQGYPSERQVQVAQGIRPVINLRADTAFTGNGSETDPFIVV